MVNDEANIPEIGDTVSRVAISDTERQIDVHFASGKILTFTVSPAFIPEYRVSMATKVAASHCCPVGPAGEAGPAGRPRVTIESNYLMIEGARAPITTAPLRNYWSEWAKLTTLLRNLGSPLTQDEWDVLKSLATTPPAVNGLTELREALKNTVKPRPAS